MSWSDMRLSQYEKSFIILDDTLSEEKKYDDGG